MTDIAIYRGSDANGKYMVNVKSKEAAGSIGGAGVIRYFNTKEEAKEYAKSVNKTGVDTFVKNPIVLDSNKPVNHEGDVFVSSAS